MRRVSFFFNLHYTPHLPASCHHDLGGNKLVMRSGGQPSCICSRDRAAIICQTRPRLNCSESCSVPGATLILHGERRTSIDDLAGCTRSVPPRRTAVSRAGAWTRPQLLNCTRGERTLVSKDALHCIPPTR
ncbi:hypothetical protein NDU88_005730 [Pleurodeles waltl]|uniref:Uncharacterized protein n=1 Tax=Pleurodeles waltl TaxID=8319 RepID=A0AAV7WZK2_PLEWA|nr:hypothetical protein NDU88_005730 [Pleurodeles waltl]